MYSSYNNRSPSPACTRREKLLQQATELVIRDYPIIPLHFQLNTWALRKPLTYEARTDERTYAHHVRPGK
jgi:peptide/nickel transport system substrate-binding protein